jgi:hypothetical protein
MSKRVLVNLQQSISAAMGANANRRREFSAWIKRVDSLDTSRKAWESLVGEFMMPGQAFRDPGLYLMRDWSRELNDPFCFVLARLSDNGDVQVIATAAATLTIADGLWPAVQEAL